MAQFSLNREEVQAEVERINKLANDVQRDAEQLVSVLKRCVATGIQTQWGIELQAQLEKFTSTQTADAINEIKLEATKLLEATDVATTFSEGK